MDSRYIFFKQKGKKVNMLATPRIGWETLNDINFLRGINE